MGSAVEERDDEAIAEGEEGNEVHDDAEGGAAAEKKKKARRRKKKGKVGGAAGSGEAQGMPSEGLVLQHFGWKVAHVKGRGRSAIAEREFAPGDLVLSERALIFCPRDGFSSHVCHACAQPLHSHHNAPPPACSSCAFTVYCESCRSSPLVSSLHASLCPLLRCVPAIAHSADCSPDLLRLLLLLASLQAKGKAAVDGQENGQAQEGRGAVADGSSKGQPGTVTAGIILSSLQDALTLSSRDSLSSPDWSASITSACTALIEAAARLHASSSPAPGTSSSTGSSVVESAGRELLQYVANSDSSTLHHWCAVLSNNVHGMGAHGPLNTDTSLGLFPFLSMLNHSCSPNCVFAAIGDTMLVRATRSIPKGTELCVSYINLYEPRAERQRQLLQSKAFVCSCERCSEALLQSQDRLLEGVLCQAGQCPGVLVRLPEKGGEGGEDSVQQQQQQAGVASVWQCDSCSRTVTEKAGVEGKEEGKESEGASKQEGEDAVVGELEELEVEEKGGEGGTKDKGKGKGGKAGKKGGKGGGGVGKGGQGGKAGKARGCEEPWEVERKAKEALSRAMDMYAEAAGGGKGSSRPAAREALEAFMAEYGGKLHPLHSFLFDARTPLMNCCRAMGDINVACEHASAVIEALDTVAPSQVLESANFLHLLAHMLQHRAESASTASATLGRRLRKQGEEAHHRAASLRRIGLGESAPMSCSH